MYADDTDYGISDWRANSSGADLTLHHPFSDRLIGVPEAQWSLENGYIYLKLPLDLKDSEFGGKPPVECKLRCRRDNTMEYADWSEPIEETSTPGLYRVKVTDKLVENTVTQRVTTDKFQKKLGYVKDATGKLVKDATGKLVEFWGSREVRKEPAKWSLHSKLGSLTVSDKRGNLTPISSGEWVIGPDDTVILALPPYFKEFRVYDDGGVIDSVPVGTGENGVWKVQLSPEALKPFRGAITEVKDAHEFVAKHPKIITYDCGGIRLEGDRPTSVTIHNWCLGDGCIFLQSAVPLSGLAEWSAGIAVENTEYAELYRLPIASAFHFRRIVDAFRDSDYIPQRCLEPATTAAGAYQRLMPATTAPKPADAKKEEPVVSSQDKIASLKQEDKYWKPGEYEPVLGHRTGDGQLGLIGPDDRISYAEDWCISGDVLYVVGKNLDKLELVVHPDLNVRGNAKRLPEPLRQVPGKADVYYARVPGEVALKTASVTNFAALPKRVTQKAVFDFSTKHGLTVTQERIALQAQSEPAVVSEPVKMITGNVNPVAVQVVGGTTDGFEFLELGDTPVLKPGVIGRADLNHNGIQFWDGEYGEDFRLSHFQLYGNCIVSDGIDRYCRLMVDGCVYSAAPQRLDSGLSVLRLPAAVADDLRTRLASEYGLRDHLDETRLYDLVHDYAPKHSHHVLEQITKYANGEINMIKVDQTLQNQVSKLTPAEKAEFMAQLGLTATPADSVPATQQTQAIGAPAEPTGAPSPFAALTSGLAAGAMTGLAVAGADQGAAAMTAMLAKTGMSKEALNHPITQALIKVGGPTLLLAIAPYVPGLKDPRITSALAMIQQTAATQVVAGGAGAVMGFAGELVGTVVQMGTLALSSSEDPEVVKAKQVLDAD